ncbi:ABC transporter permease subunit [Chitinophaga sp. G-6-1-13]|uniref:ABC transporter permease subunit n=1 Tax=Chitinophaga fulva TaxID=2728842 RepID=A0A848GN85_9BACT|nr:Gldg family protein [Chitinophaga fulva]NML39874.1 ABC transporter permease subunit [Chitinophaga fulva]
MKMIFKIAKTELRNLFYSPVAWFLTIAFMVQCGVYYVYPLYGLANWQDIVSRNNPGITDFGISMTETLFLGNDGIFSSALQNLYLFVPLLTMGLISREMNSGTIKLLYSSPIRTREIVLGKYLAIMIYNMLLVGIVGIFMIVGALNIHLVDYGVLLSAALGFYLLVCTYTAIGLFMSSLTNYQIVSAIGSFIIIFVLGHIGGLWQKYDFVRDLTYFLSISGRTIKMMKGLITTKDVIYFVIIAYMFVTFTLIKMKAGRESRPWWAQASRYVAVFASVLVIGYVSSRSAFIGYWDTTRRQTNTLHPNTQTILKELGKEPMEITLYTNLVGPGVHRGLPENRNDYLWNLWEPYLRFKPDIKFNYVYYYDTDDADSSLYKTWVGKSLPEIAALNAEGLQVNIKDFKVPAEVRKMIDLQPEGYRLVMQLKYKGKTTFLRTFDDANFWPEEQQVAASLKRLLPGNMPKNIFLTGNLERSIYKRGEREYSSHAIAKENRQSLINLGFDSDSLCVETQEIPSDISTLVLADPKTALTATAVEKINRYINNGGNMLIFGEPGKQQILNPVLKQLGVQLMDGTLIEVSKDEMPHMVKPVLSSAGLHLSEDPALAALRELQTGGKGMGQLMPGVTGITFGDSSAFKAAPLLITVPGSAWLKAGTVVTDSTAPVFNPQEGDTRQPSYATAVGLTRMINGKEQHIAVSADADFMSNLRQGGGFLGIDLYAWMVNDAFPIFTPKIKPVDTRLTITAATATMEKYLFVWILPGLVLLGGTILLVRRKRQ